MNRCIKCNKEKADLEFPKRNNGTLRNECRTCTAQIARNYRKKNKNKLRIQSAIRNYSISKEKVIDLYNTNNCHICENEFKNNKDKHIDHCHETNKVRGVLCANCNHALGKFQDNISILEQAIKYLKQ